MARNYEAWEISADAFSRDWSDVAKLRFFARYAVLAPSGHNTQPWRFEFDDHALTLRVDPERCLPYSGQLAAEPHISLGACLETLVMAALGFGYELDVTRSEAPDAIAVVTLGEGTDPQPDVLDAITRRTSNRTAFQRTGLGAELLDRLVPSARNGVSPFVITARDDIDFIADQTAKATRVIMSDHQFRRELSHWVRSNLTKRPDGMPGFVQGMPLPPSLIAKHIVRHVDISKTQARADAGRVTDSAALILIMSDGEHHDSRLEAGRFYARIAVNAEREGVATSGVAAALVDRTARAAVVQRFGISARPVALLRLGLPTKSAPHSPRRQVDDVSATSAVVAVSAELRA